MLGSIAGDIIGSVYEWNNIRNKNFPLFNTKCFFTDDTVLTCATAEAILNNKDYSQIYRDYFRMYPNRGYGGRFRNWAKSDSEKPYNSFGNGSAMRVSPVGFAYDSMEEVLSEAKRSSEVTHNHKEGVKGAQATAACIFMARRGESKEAIKSYVENNFNYNLNNTVANLQKYNKFDETCQGSVPESIICFLESNDFEDAIRNAISIGGDSDTIACITGGIAEAYYGGVPNYIKKEVFSRLDPRLVNIVQEFRGKYIKEPGVVDIEE